MENDALQNVKIVNTTYFSVGFPSIKWDAMIIRDNYHAILDDFVSSESNILFIEGEEDSGKTILCAQFIHRNIKNSISLFLNPLNNVDYQIDFFCLNIVNQIKFLLNEDIEKIDQENFISVEEYRQYLFQLRKLLKKNNDKLIFIIDGLENKAQDSQDFINEIFSLLPFGEDHFRIIITGNQNDFITIWPKLKDYNVPQI